jgi:phosphoribosyl-ATP pyrophosphohydrolase
MQDDPLDRLEAVIAARRGGDPAASYVAALTAQGRPHLARKFGEEAVETVIAALGDDRAALTAEAADTIFHLLVLLADAGVTLDDLRAELARRSRLATRPWSLSRRAAMPVSDSSSPRSSAISRCAVAGSGARLLMPRTMSAGSARLIEDSVLTAWPPALVRK